MSVILYQLENGGNWMLGAELVPGNYFLRDLSFVDGIWNLGIVDPKDQTYRVESQPLSNYKKLNGESYKSISELDRLCGEFFLDDYQSDNSVAVVAPQEIVYSATPEFDFSVSKKGFIILTGDVSEFVFSNIPNGGEGTLKIIQDEVGGFGIAFISHEGLETQYLAGEAPNNTNINTEPSGHTDLHYERVGEFLYVSFGPMNTVNLPD